jgi:hypothetical protein
MQIFHPTSEKTLDELLNAEIDAFIDGRHAFDFLPLSSQAPCKGNYCQEDSIV